jgi:DNA (cytosine-5)-methyltransferase 1
MSLGFQNAGFNVVAAYDNWGPAISVYEQNFSHPVFSLDLGSDEAIHTIARHKPEIIVGGPPCQDFSSAGPDNFQRSRATLIGSFVEAVGGCLPNYFVMENVPRARRSGIYQDAAARLREFGYGLTEYIVDASYCGVPQTRKRLFLIGRLGGAEHEIKPFLDSALTSEPLTLRQFFGDELEIDYYFRIPTTYKRKAVFTVDAPSMTIRGVERPIPSTYKKHPDDPVTIDEGVRVLTIRERASIQTFPKDFRLLGTKGDLNQMIGNAVPVRLAEFVANAVVEFDRQLSPVIEVGNL